MKKWASLKANTHSEQTNCSDEQTYFRPACVLGNDKSGMQKENEGCQIKQNPPADVFLLPKHSVPNPLKVHSGQSCGCADSSQCFVGQLASCVRAINRRIGCAPWRQRESAKRGQFVPLMPATDRPDIGTSESLQSPVRPVTPRQPAHKTFGRCNWLCLFNKLFPRRCIRRFFNSTLTTSST